MGSHGDLLDLENSVGDDVTSEGDRAGGPLLSLSSHASREIETWENLAAPKGGGSNIVWHHLRCGSGR